MLTRFVVMLFRALIGCRFNVKGIIILHAGVSGNTKIEKQLYDEEKRAKGYQNGPGKKMI